MTPITKFEEEVATNQISGVCVPRQRLFTARGWTYAVWTGPPVPVLDGSRRRDEKT